MASSPPPAPYADLAALLQEGGGGGMAQGGRGEGGGLGSDADDIELDPEVARLVDQSVKELYKVLASKVATAIRTEEGDEESGGAGAGHGTQRGGRPSNGAEVLRPSLSASKMNIVQKIEHERALVSQETLRHKRRARASDEAHLASVVEKVRSHRISRSFLDVLPTMQGITGHVDYPEGLEGGGRGEHPHRSSVRDARSVLRSFLLDPRYKEERGGCHWVKLVTWSGARREPEELGADSGDEGGLPVRLGEGDCILVNDDMTVVKAIQCVYVDKGADQVTVSRMRDVAWEMSMHYCRLIKRLFPAAEVSGLGVYNLPGGRLIARRVLQSAIREASVLSTPGPQDLCRGGGQDFAEWWTKNLSIPSGTGSPGERRRRSSGGWGGGELSTPEKTPKPGTAQMPVSYMVSSI